MNKFVKMLNEIITEKKDADIADLPPIYKKVLKPYESEIDVAYVDEKTAKTILYINKEYESSVKDITKAVGKENVEKIDKSGEGTDIKIILK